MPDLQQKILQQAWVHKHTSYKNFTVYFWPFARTLKQPTHIFHVTLKITLIATYYGIFFQLKSLCFKLRKTVKYLTIYYSCQKPFCQ